MTVAPSFLQDPDIRLNEDGEGHLRIRRIVASAFTPRRVERWKPVLEDAANELVDALEQAGPPADQVTDY